jgi:hypothetical protein
MRIAAGALESRGAIVVSIPMHPEARNHYSLQGHTRVDIDPYYPVCTLLTTPVARAKVMGNDLFSGHERGPTSA